jgi:hypothetical protein
MPRETEKTTKCSVLINLDIKKIYITYADCINEYLNKGISVYIISSVLTCLLKSVLDYIMRM